MFRNLWEHIRDEMPKKGRGKVRRTRSAQLPAELQTALFALYSHYEETFEQWQQAGIEVAAGVHRRLQQHRPPRSSSMNGFPAGSARAEDGEELRTVHHGHLALFSNYDEHGNRLARPQHAADRQRAA